MSSRRPRLVGTTPPEILVYDEPTNCPYLEAKTARLPMRLPARPLDREEFGRRLAEGDRRQGLVLYRPTCPDCSACESLRIAIADFRPSRSQKRVFKRGEREFDVEIGKPKVDDRRIELYNRHKSERDLLGDGDPIDASGYRAFLVDTCTESLELRYLVNGELAGIAIVDRGANALSAVYTYFDPDYSALSPGVYSIMKQAELCRRWSLEYLYLGLYVRGCDAMGYKSRYTPHERFISGRWQKFERRPETESADELRDGAMTPESFSQEPKGRGASGE